MAKDPSQTEEKTREGEGVVLRDESDEIIDNLKSQLSSLQSQLDAYKTVEHAPGASGAGDGGQDLLNSWSASLTPHLASRLQLPAEELTSRLDRLIEQAEEPELREELERCRDLAFFFYETFHKISNNHRLLTESLTSPKLEVEMADFCRLLEHPLPQQGTPVPVHRQPGLPRRMTFASRSAVTVVKALAELAATLFGKELQIEVGHAAPREADLETEAADPDSTDPETVELTLRVYTDAGGTDADVGEEVSVFAMRRGITANTVVDLLYVEKIIELQGGSFAFDRRGGKVHGFVVRLPSALPPG